MTTEDIRLEGMAGRLGAVLTTVVTEGRKGKGKGYRLPTSYEIEVANSAKAELNKIYKRGLVFSSAKHRKNPLNLSKVSRHNKVGLLVLHQIHRHFLIHLLIG